MLSINISVNVSVSVSVGRPAVEPRYSDLDMLLYHRRYEELRRSLGLPSETPAVPAVPAALRRAARRN